LPFLTAAAKVGGLVRTQSAKQEKSFFLVFVGVFFEFE
jgi:hypothetical protein